jgi:hypothetical protein
MRRHAPTGHRSHRNGSLVARTDERLLDVRRAGQGQRPPLVNRHSVEPNVGHRQGRIEGRAAGHDEKVTRDDECTEPRVTAGDHHDLVGGRSIDDGALLAVEDPPDTRGASGRADCIHGPLALFGPRQRPGAGP